MPERHREALLAFAAAGFELRDLPSITDWDALVAAARAHRLLPLADRLLSTSPCAPEVRKAVHGQALIVAIRGMQLQQEQGKILAALTAAGVDTIVLKGAAIANTVYPSPSLRPFTDLDVLCHEEDWSRVHDSLVKQGFLPLQGLREPPPKVWSEKAHYHTQYDREDGAVRVEVHYDPWWYGLRPRSRDAIWMRACPLIVGGVPAKRLATEDQLLLSCLHAHHHGFNLLIYFSDLALLLRSGSIDWSCFVATARAEGMGVVVYFSLHYLAELLDVRAPEWVLQALHPHPVQSWLHEWLWPSHAILGLAVTDRVLFDFHEVPEAAELLLNMVLTGRRREKLQYIGHLLVPPSAWLAYYHQTSDPFRLRWLRLIHAPNLVLRALGEIGHVVLHGLTRQPLST